MERPPDSSRWLKLWVVLEEKPLDQSGYKIVSSEQVNRFGLGVPSDPRDVFIGFHGSFLDTYAAI